MYSAANYLLFLGLLGVLAAHLYLAWMSKSVCTRYLIVAYSAGMAFYLILPSGMKILFGDHLMNLPFSSSLGVDDALLTKIMLAVLVCISVSLFTFVIVSGVGKKSEQGGGGGDLDLWVILATS